MRSKVALLIAALVLSGCTVRTYKLTKDRIDQDLTTGNRGYMQGRAPAVDTSARPTTRTTQVVEVEIRPLIKFEKGPKSRPVETATPVVEQPATEEIVGNRGYITQSESPAIQAPTMEQYKVKKGDTLQKISKKFYGTSKKWTKIYNANKDVLKAPDRVYPGQVINVPVLEGKAKEKAIPAHLK